MVKNSLLTRHTSPRNRLSLQFSQAVQQHKLKHLSCPVRVPTKRLLYQCPKCRRFRSFLDDRDQFILYGVTRLWPTPPPAPPPQSSPSTQVIDTASSSPSALVGTYDICRIYHTRSAKLHSRNLQRPNPSPAMVRSSPGCPTSRQKRGSASLLAANYSHANYSHINHASNDLAQMVDVYKRCMSPLKCSSSISTARSSQSATRTQTATYPGSQAMDTVLSKRPRSGLSHSASKAARVISSPNALRSIDVKRESLPPSKLEIWTRRLRCGQYLKSTDWVVINSGVNLANITPVESAARKRKRKRKRKHHSSKRRNSKSKSNETSRPSSGQHETLSRQNSTILKSETSSPVNGRVALGQEMTSAKGASPSRSEVAKSRIAAKRARSFSTHSSPESGGQRQELTPNRKVEVVKIGDEQKETKAKTGKPTRIKKLARSVSVDGPSIRLDVETAALLHNSRPCNSLDNPSLMLEDFRNRMKRCRGKGHIKSSPIEVMAYLEGRRQGALFQALPKTYQQMGLAPLTRSPSSENYSHFFKITDTLSASEAMPKMASRGYTRRKKKKKPGQSRPNNSNKDPEKDTTKMKHTQEIKSHVQKVRSSSAQGKLKLQRRRQNAKSRLVSTASQVTSTASIVTNTASPVTNTASTVTNTASPITNTASQVTNTASPVTNTASQVTNIASPVTNTASPVTYTASSVTYTTSPVTNTASPFTNTASPVTNTASPVTNTTSPVTNTASPVTNTTSPIINNLTPVIRTSPPATNKKQKKHQQNTNKTPTKHQQNTNKTPTKHQQNTNKTPTKHQQNTNKTLASTE